MPSFLSVNTSTPQCNVVNFSYAHSLCESVGARLCDTREILNDEVRATGCGFDDTYVWTKTRGKCPANAFEVLAGNPNVFGDEFPLSCRASSALAAVRCCADSQAQRDGCVTATCQDLAWAKTLHAKACAHLARCDDTATRLYNDDCTSIGDCVSLCTSASRSLVNANAKEAMRVCNVHGAHICTTEELAENRHSIAAVLGNISVSSASIFVAENKTNAMCGVNLHPAAKMHASSSVLDNPVCLQSSTRLPVACCADKDSPVDPCVAVHDVSVADSPLNTKVEHTFVPPGQRQNEQCNWALHCANTSRMLHINVTEFNSASHHQFLQIYDINYYNLLEKSDYDVNAGTEFYVTLDSKWPPAVSASLLGVLDGPGQHSAYKSQGLGTRVLLRTLADSTFRQTSSSQGAFVVLASCVEHDKATSTSSPSSATSFARVQPCQAACPPKAFDETVTANDTQAFPGSCYQACPGQRLRFDGASAALLDTVQPLNLTQVAVTASDPYLPFLNARVEAYNGASIEFVGLRVHNQQSNGNGGVFMCRSCNVSIRWCDFRYNRASSFGGVFLADATSTVNIANSTFVSNTARKGGGVAHSFATLNISRCVFMSNRASTGGVFYLGTGVRGPGGLSGIHDSGFSSNLALETRGGAIVCQFPEKTDSGKMLDIRRCTFKEDYANSGGGGLYVHNSPIKLLHTTFSSETTHSGKL